MMMNLFFKTDNKGNLRKCFIKMTNILKKIQKSAFRYPSFLGCRVYLILGCRHPTTRVLSGVGWRVWVSGIFRTPVPDTQEIRLLMYAQVLNQRNLNFLIFSVNFQHYLIYFFAFKLKFNFKHESFFFLQNYLKIKSYPSKICIFFLKHLIFIKIEILNNIFSFFFLILLFLGLFFYFNKKRLKNIKLE